MEQGLDYYFNCQVFEERIDLDLFNNYKRNIDWFLLDESDIHELNKLLLYNFGSGGLNPIVYSIHVPHLGIKKTKLGLKIIQFIKNKGISLISEMDNYLMK